MANHEDAKLHIAMVPWLAFGHLIPFLQLAKLMASKGHTISFISTPTNIHRLPKIPQTLTPFITFIQVNLPNLQNLPRHAESTKDVPSSKVKHLKIAFDHLRAPIADFLTTSPPDWIIFDFASYWLGPLAAQHRVKSAFFSVFPAVVLGFVGSPEVAMHGDDSRATLEDYIRLPKWVDFQSRVRPTRFQLTRSHENLNPVEEAVSDVYRLGATVHGCDAVIVRSSPDFEPQWLNLLNKLYKKPVIPAGVLPAVDECIDDACWLQPKQWLDKQAKDSVVYIAFGTETKPSQYELTQLALGIELSGLGFYWVLIDQRGASDDVAVQLPRGFEERTRGRGVVCRGWAPQFKILSHEAVGGLLIHSGVGSVVEGLQVGKPLVLLPLLLDQGVIASYLVEKRVACAIDREDGDGSFTPESVAHSLSLVMVREEGKVHRDRAKEMMRVFADREAQDKRVDDLIHFLSD